MDNLQGSHTDSVGGTHRESLKKKLLLSDAECHFQESVLRK